MAVVYIVLYNPSSGFQSLPNIPKHSRETNFGINYIKAMKSGIKRCRRCNNL